MSATAVHVNHTDRTDPRFLYVGRAMPRQRLAGSPFANPFHVDAKRGITAEHAVRQYAAYLLEQPDLLARLPELRGKVLGCWCRDPKHPDAPCHAALLSELPELNALEIMLRLREVATSDPTPAADR